MARTPVERQQFPVNYMVLQPSLDVRLWDKDYNVYYRFISPATKKTLQGISISHDSFTIWHASPTLMGHAQLDTITRIKNEEALHGIWRVVKHRQLQFTDSASYKANAIFRADSVMQDITTDDAFLCFSNGKIRLFVKPEYKDHFKAYRPIKYELEHGRSLLLKGFFKVLGNVAQVGIDQEGRLILHSITQIERKVKGEYVTYIAIIEQLIFEKVN